MIWFRGSLPRNFFAPLASKGTESRNKEDVFVKKRTFSWIALCLSILLLAGLTAGCGGRSNSSETASGGSMAKAAAPVEAPAAFDISDEAYWDGGEYYGGAAQAAPAPDYGEAILPGESGTAPAETFDKIIYSGSANVETIRFDETLEQVYALIAEYGGFLESSYVSGKDYYSTYYSRPSYRSASFTIRVPREKFQSFTGALEALGNLTNSSVQAQNITSSYFDTQSRLNTYRTEEERLLDMLKKAETVEDMLNIEDRLASVRYNIESLTTTLTNWDSKVNYSTVDLYISEVKELTPETPITRTFGEELSQRFRDSWEGLVRGVKNFVLFLLGASPILIPVLAVIVVIILIIRSKIRKKREKKAVEVDR